MAGRSVAARLFDILDAGHVVETAVAGLERTGFIASRVARAAVERELEIVSEAVKHLPTKLKARWPTIPWDDIRGFGDIARHAYCRLDPDIVWTIAVAESLAVIQAIRSEAPLDGLAIDPAADD